MNGGWTKLWMQRLGILALLLGLVMGVYVNSLGNGFHDKDYHVITENSWIRSLSNSLMFFTSGSMLSQDSEATGYKPVLILSYAMNYAISGLKPWGYHLVQMMIHAGSALLVYWLVWRFHKNNMMAILAAVLFGLHPANTEAVNYLAARSSLLSGFFILLALSGYLYFRSEEGSPKPFRILTYIGSILAFALAILSNETALVLPLLLVAYDLYFSSAGQSKLSRQLMIGYIPFILLGASYLVFQFFLVRASTAAPTLQLDTLASLLTVLNLFARYVILFVWPLNLKVDYPISQNVSVLEGEALFSIALIGGLVVGIWLLYHRARGLSFACLWLLIGLLPIGILPFITHVTLFQENQGYLASAGFAMAVSWGLFNLPVLGNVRWLRNVLMIAICTWYGLAVFSRNTVWRDEVTLWSDALKKNPQSAVAHLSLGSHYFRQRQWDLAAQAYQKALELVPEDPKAMTHLGRAYYKQGHLDQAQEILRTALKLHPDDPRIHNTFGVILLQAGKFDDAINEYKEAIRISPTDWEARLNLGWAYSRQNEWDTALNTFQMALQTNTHSPEIYISLGVAFKALGKLENAQQSFEQALRIDSTLTPAYEQLSELYVQQGKVLEATKLLEKLLSLNPENAQAHHALGYLSEQQANYEAALKHYNEAIRLEPNRYGTYFNLGNIHWRFGDTDLALQAYQKAIELEPRFIYARFNMGKLLENSGKRQQAIDQYKLVLDLARLLGNQTMEKNAKESLERLLAGINFGGTATQIPPPVHD